MRAMASASGVTQRGAAALIVVVVLFFILAMVTAYAGRNLIFEQRTSINNQRASQAFEAAEAGLEHAIGLLGSGRIDAQCQPTTDVTMTTFRDRMLTQEPSNGVFTGVTALLPTCMLLNGGANCSCPTAGSPVLAPPVGGLAPTFQVRFETGIAQPGVVRAISKGCNSIGKQCYRDDFAGSADAVAEVSVLLGLNSALATPPLAALTVGRTLDLSGGSAGIHNADVPSGGITIDAGGPMLNAGSVRLSSVPGTPGSASVRPSDPSLSTLSPDRMFVSVFGMDRATYRTQPAVVQVTCAGDCATAIATTVSRNPGRVVWVQGPVTIDSSVVLGSPASPVMLFIQGDLVVTANLQIHGMVYLHDPSGANVWATGAGSTLIRGAVIAEGDLTVHGPPAIAFDPDVLRTVRLTQGSMVRVPGSWRDFAAGS